MADLDDVEARLREFKPRRPASIPDERLQLLRGTIWVAVAAAMAAVMLIATWIQKPQPRPATTATKKTLTELALERPEEFDAEMSRISATSLPDVTAPGGALEPLAKGF